MDGDAHAQAGKERMVGSEPFFADAECGVQDGRVGVEDTVERALPGQLDDQFGEGVDRGLQRAEHQDGLAVIDQAPGGGQRQLLRVFRERELALLAGDGLRGEEPGT